MADRNSFCLVTLNCFLLPAWFTHNNPTCTNQAGRATAIGHLLRESGADVLCLQEVWGSNTAELEAPLPPLYVTLPGYGSWGATWIDAGLNYLMSKGGLWSGYKVGHSVRYQDKFSFVNKGEKSAKGAVACLLELSLSGGGRAARGDDDDDDDDPLSLRHVLVINTHLGWVPDVQVQQLWELGLFIDRVAEHLVAARFVPSGKEMAVIAVGDFNIRSVDRFLYDRMLAILGARDLHKECCEARGTRPEATHDGENSLVTGDHSSRIDYVLAIDGVPSVAAALAGARLANKPTSSRAPHAFARVVCTEVEVMKQRLGSEVSDHWGIRAHVRREARVEHVTAPPAEHWTYANGYIVHTQSGRVLDVDGGNLLAGTPVIVWPRLDSVKPWQQWTFATSGTVVSKLNELVLGIVEGRVVTCAGGEDQRWEFGVDGALRHAATGTRLGCDGRQLLVLA